MKFQKRTVDVVYTEEELTRPRESPFGKTNGDLKRGLEFGKMAYNEIDAYCKALGIDWYASPWDLESLDFLLRYDPPYIKIASPMNQDTEFLEEAARTEIPLLVSTGMSDWAMVENTVSTIEEVRGEIACLYHCVSTYPTWPSELDLRAIETLRRDFPFPVGYSGHEVGVATSVMAVVLGATFIERHITLDRSMWGSDQAASLEPQGMARLVRDIRTWEIAQGDGIIKVTEGEKDVERKLRRVNNL